MESINACRQRFMVEAVTLFLSIKGRINFQQLERYGKYNEQRYRIQFEKAFDFMAFNSGLVSSRAFSSGQQKTFHIYFSVLHYLFTSQTIVLSV